MGKKDFFDLENQIKNALNNVNLSKLKNDINNKTEDALNEVKTNLKYKSRSIFNEKIKNRNFNSYKPFDNFRPNMNIISKDKDINELDMYIAKRSVGSISGLIYIILGITFGGIFGTLLILYSIFTSLLTFISTGSFIALAVLSCFFALSIAFTVKGFNLRKRVKRFRLYAKSLNKYNYCAIDKLSSIIKKKNKFIIKDLKKMIDLGMFPQAHIDDNNTYFMLNDKVYEDYLRSQEALKYRREAELKKQEELREEINDPEKKELRYALELGRNYIKQIKNINESICRQEISSKLNRLQSIISQIFNYLENNPNKLHEVNQFTNHYLPITLKLVNAYKDLNDQPVEGDNIKASKNEIEKTIDIINTAFEKLLDDLFRDTSLDISTDISVLETLFKQEGLTKNDFNK